jgi:hypothetical protein
VSIVRTFLSEAHFDLEGFEIVRYIGLDFASHALSCPLFKTIEFLIDVHDCVVEMVVGRELVGQRI